MAVYNSTYLTHHFLYTYSNAYSLPPSDEVQNQFKDDLIFDKTRRSIHTQLQEFGYISNIESEIVARTGDDTDFTYIRLVVDKGYITFDQYIPASFQYCEYTYTASGAIEDNVFELGSEISIERLEQRIRGNHPLVFWNFVIPGVLANNFMEREALVETINENRQEFGFSTTNMSFSDITLSSNEPKVFELITSVQDDRMDRSTSYTKILISYNHSMILEFGDEEHKTYPSIRDAIFESNDINSVGNRVVLDHLINDYRIDTVENPLKCENGKNKFLGLYFPDRLYDEDVVTGVINGGSTQEFKKCAKLAYTNGAGFTENYNLYLSPNENWKGSSLVINKML